MSMRQKLTEERWRRLEALFEAAVELPASQQETYILRETAGDPALQSALAGMLAHAGDGAGKIAQVIEGLAQETSSATQWIGRRFGPYRLAGEIGRGGMGLVFEAVRADDEYQKTVALKIAPWWRDVDLLRERFRHERQILADLEHPNIARFLDGGTEDGIPYFAMEYVRGVHITEYAARIPLAERIHLFRKVCAAVHHAHERLVVHRDLKPANILVDQEGSPKLLDFGIAKLLSPVPDADGKTTEPMLCTPDYTSPEQIRGLPVTTRTDIYSLGLILYEILSGKRAQTADTSSPLAFDQSICEGEPELVSVRAANRALAGDLDTIVAMAIRKEPERRYGSVAELSDDLLRYLDGEPVKARPGTFFYRAGKLVRRHRVVFAAATLLAASLATGIVTTLHQARRAEWRFEQVRKLANAFVFDVHDRVENLPGSTEARKAIVQTALVYLENLAEDATGDAALSRELAAAWEKIGDVQGRPSASNIGDAAGAINSYRRAEKLLTPLEARGDNAAARQLASVSARLGAVRRAQGEVRVAMADYARGAAICDRLLASAPQDREILNVAGEIYADITRAFLALDDRPAAEQAAEKTKQIAERCIALDPAGLDARDKLSYAHTSIGAARLARGRLEEAAESYRAAIAIRAQLVVDAPDHTAFRRNLMVSYGTLGDVLGFRTADNLGDTAGATAAFRKATEIAEWLCRNDPADRKAQFDLSSAYMRLGSVLAEDPRETAAGLRQLLEAERINSALHAADPKNYRYRYNSMFMDRKIGEALDQMGRTGEAIARLEAAQALAIELKNGPDGPGARLQNVLASLRLARIRSRTHDPRATALADAIATEVETPPTLLKSQRLDATISGGLGRIYRQIGQPGRALPWLERSRKSWNEAKLPRALESSRDRELAELRSELAALPAIQIPSTVAAR